MLQITDLSVKISDISDTGDKIIISGFNININKSELHVIMGPNGCGKSTLAYSILGHEKYKISSGDIIFDKTNILDMPTEKRARLGIFLGFQTPVEIPGVQIFNFLKDLYQNRFGNISVQEFQNILYKFMDQIGLDHGFAYRYLNDGFSGGQKKKLELLQMLILKPKLAILDEIDSGLDVDAIKTVAEAILQAKKDNPDMSIILITHNTKILKYLSVDTADNINNITMHVMLSGKIIKTGSIDLATRIDNLGYAGLCVGY